MEIFIPILSKTTLLERELTVYGDIQAPLFMANDVAKWIENSNVSQMLQSVDDDEKALYTIYRVDGSTHKAWFITESGLYEVLMQSRKPIAKKFKKGVKTILKEIRIKGGYLATTIEDTAETIMAKALMIADETIRRQVRNLNELNAVKYELEQKVIADKPKVEWADKNQESEGLHTVSACVHDQRICASYMNRVLEHYKVQRKVGGEWTLTTPWQNRGFAETNPVFYQTKDSDKECTTSQLKWFEKGRNLILQLITHARKDGFLVVSKRTGRYTINTKGDYNYTNFKFIN